MDMGKKSTAGPRQFEQTAIAKLQLLGVPKNIADAFVKIGVPKSGRVQEIKDHVCKMEYKPFFIPTSLKDYADPLRVGAYVPYVYESKDAKFHCEFQMTDLETAKFVKQFPEYDVTAKGRVSNQHGFYANKRYAECELLVDMVYSDARFSGLDPQSLVDLGGNDSWHAKRGRSHVHCDNPVLSPRDAMRYRVREIMSGSNSEKACRRTFNDCEFVADYGIGVHSTYDLSPKNLARGMLSRGMKRFFGVINFIPGIETKKPGVYEVDGIVMKVVDNGRQRPTIECGFRHDPSLKYDHSLNLVKRYLTMSRRYDITDDKGEVVSFVYKIESVRGNSIIFSVKREERYISLKDFPLTAPSGKKYFLSMPHLDVRDLEVDSELFDRLVLQAASARNIAEYDILSLYRYAKSLRQRVVLSGAVLSSGFLYNSEELVYAVIAAYGTAAAFRAESGQYFKEASSQMISRRSQGFIVDVFRIVGKTLLEALLVLPKGLGYVTGLAAIDKKLRRAIRDKGSISVCVHKPHANSGMTYDSRMLTKTSAEVRAKAAVATGTLPTLRALFYGSQKMPIDVHVEGKVVTLLSHGLVPYDPEEVPAPTPRVALYTLPRYAVKDHAGWVEEARDYYYRTAIDRVAAGRFDASLSVMANGDRIARHGTTLVEGVRQLGRQDMAFVPNRQKYAVFRGVGNRVMNLRPPAMYEGSNCIGFYLFFDDRLDDSGRVTDTTDFESGMSTLEGSDGSAADATGLTDAAWEDLTPAGQEYGLKVFTSRDEAAAFMETDVAQVGHYMSGALPGDGQFTPPPDEPDPFVKDYVSRVDTIGKVTADLSASGEAVELDPVLEAKQQLRPATPKLVAEDESAVDSDDVVSGKDAMEEIVKVCNMSKDVGIATAKLVIDIATAVARGESTSRAFKAVAQGHPGNLIMVRVLETGECVEFGTQTLVDHMAVSDGEQVFDFLTNPPPAGVYVTSDALKIYTGGAICDSISSVMSDPYSAPVTCVDGVAGSGKSYHIEHSATRGDVVLCETRASLNDLAKGLERVDGWQGAVYTIDSFLMHRQVKTAKTLWVDEAFRLHAGKIHALVKILRPERVYCFGDSKQIPSLPFVPGYDFSFHEFPFSEIRTVKETWRCPADVCFTLSPGSYYGVQVTTHNPVMKSLTGPVHYVSGMFEAKPQGHALLVYERDIAHDLRNGGVKNVFTIGEAQGKTFDHVMLYRYSQNGKQIYFDKFQALVALTRHRRSFTYVTNCSVATDDSTVADRLRYVQAKGTELLLSSHYCTGVKAARDYVALENREAAGQAGGGGRAGASSSGDEELEVSSRDSDWAAMAEEEFDMFD